MCIQRPETEEVKLIETHVKNYARLPLDKPEAYVGALDSHSYRESSVALMPSVSRVCMIHTSMYTYVHMHTYSYMRSSVRSFVRDLLAVPCFADRLFCLIFQSSFQEQLSSMQYTLDNVKSVSEACTCLLLPSLLFVYFTLHVLYIYITLLFQYESINFCLFTSPVSPREQQHSTRVGNCSAIW